VCRSFILAKRLNNLETGFLVFCLSFKVHAPRVFPPRFALWKRQNKVWTLNEAKSSLLLLTKIEVYRKAEGIGRSLPIPH